MTAVEMVSEIEYEDSGEYGFRLGSDRFVVQYIEEDVLLNPALIERKVYRAERSEGDDYHEWVDDVGVKKAVEVLSAFDLASVAWLVSLKG